jgi:uncharacterized membrane protein YuzA (DUF378 family)
MDFKVGKMTLKYFLQWLVQDIKTEWHKNASARRKMWGVIGHMTKIMARIFSVLVLIVVALAIVIITVTGNGNVKWDQVAYTIGGVAALNMLIFLFEKYDKFLQERELLIQMLKD